MTESTEHWYLDWKFWSALLSLIAIALSQLPPIKLWFRRKRIEVEVPSRILISHQVGNPNVAMAISLRNTGGRALLVRSIDIKLTRDGTDLGSFRAQNYFETPSSQTTALMVPFSMKPDDIWVHGTNFLNFFARATEKHYRAIEWAIREDIQKKLDAKAPEDKKLVEAESALVEPFLQLFDKLFIWEPGEYVMDLRVNTEPGSATFSKRYRFTLYESDTAELRKHTEDYIYGGRITWTPTNKPIGVAVPLIDFESA